MPIDAKQLPAQTTIIEAEVIDGTRETDPHIRQMFTSAELGSEICRAGTLDPAVQLEVIGLLGSSSAKQFFAAQNLESVRSLLECGQLLTANLDGNFQTAIGFTDDSSTKQEVGILQLKAQDIPPKYGLTKHAFSGVDGYCRTSDPSKPTAAATDCTATSEAALHQANTWLFGKRAALDTAAHTMATPRTDLSTQVAALNDAAAETEGLSSTRIQADLGSAKSFIGAPCGWGAFQTAGSSKDFFDSCFPNSDEKLIEGMDAKLRAAAFELEPDVVKAGAVHGNIILVARDGDAAKDVEKDANELVTDWKSQLQNNEAKLIKQAKTDPISLRQKAWATYVDNFLHAVENMKVTRSGRTVHMSFNDALLDDDRRDLTDADKQTRDRRAAIADVLSAIAAKQALPQDALAKIVGAPWATFFIQSAQFDPATKAALPAGECKDLKKAASKLKAHDMTNKEASALLSELAFADCNHPPHVMAATHACLTGGFRTAVDFAKCAPPQEPAEVDFGDKPTAHANK
jgi:hypothetical protein